MRQPEFWYQKRGLCAWLLTPLGALYAASVRRRLRIGRRVRAEIPVICVGNLNVGGSGKTPTVLAIAARLTNQGFHPHFVSRGYGGQIRTGPLQVDIKKHNSDLVGDEPLLLAAFAPTWVGSDRLESVQQAAQMGADLVILDDGFQDPSLRHDLAIVVVDASRGFGNGEVLPAGPLREPVQQGLGRADVLMVIGNTAQYTAFRQRWGHLRSLATMRGNLQPVETGVDWSKMRVVAFAGIAHPEKFFTTLKMLGATIIREFSLADHAPISERLLQRMRNCASAASATLVTTEKDSVRLPDTWRHEVLSLPVRLQIKDTEIIDGLLAQFGPSQEES